MRQGKSFRIAIVAALIAIGAGLVIKKSPRKNESQNALVPVTQEAAPEVDSKIENKTPQASLPETTVVTTTATVPTPTPSTERQMTELQTRFAEQLSRLERNLPTREMMKHKTIEEVHDTPQEVLDAGGRLALLKEAWLNNPELKPQARAFYQTCAHQAQYLASIRSLCLVNARALNQDLHLDKMDEDKIPQNIKNIADQIPN